MIPKRCVSDFRSRSRSKMWRLRNKALKPDFCLGFPYLKVSSCFGVQLLEKPTFFFLKQNLTWSLPKTELCGSEINCYADPHQPDSKIGFRTVLWSRSNLDRFRLPTPAPGFGLQLFCNTNLSRKSSFKN